MHKTVCCARMRAIVRRRCGARIAAGVTAVAFVPVWICEAILPVAFAVIALRYALFAVKHMRLSVIDEDVL